MCFIDRLSGKVEAVVIKSSPIFSCFAVFGRYWPRLDLHCFLHLLIWFSPYRSTEGYLQMFFFSNCSLAPISLAVSFLISSLQACPSSRFGHFPAPLLLVKFCFQRYPSIRQYQSLVVDQTKLGKRKTLALIFWGRWFKSKTKWAAKGSQGCCSFTQGRWLRCHPKNIEGIRLGKTTPHVRI